MGLLSSKQVLIGAILIIVGTLGMLPGVLPSAAQVMTYTLVPAAAAIVLGTYLLGTSEGGRAV